MAGAGGSRGLSRRRCTPPHPRPPPTSRRLRTLSMRHLLPEGAPPPWPVDAACALAAAAAARSTEAHSWWSRSSALSSSLLPHPPGTQPGYSSNSAGVVKKGCSPRMACRCHMRGRVSEGGARALWCGVVWVNGRGGERLQPAHGLRRWGLCIPCACPCLPSAWAPPDPAHTQYLPCSRPSPTSCARTTLFMPSLYAQVVQLLEYSCEPVVRGGVRRGGVDIMCEFGVRG